MHYWIWIIVIIAVFKMAASSGVFELRLKSFTNDLGRDSSGQCCSGEPASSELCGEPCRTMFRVCLKLYQAKIDTTSPCTFGDVITPVLGQNSFQLGQSNLEGFLNPIRFPFDFGWPGTFSLIVEAWHDTNASSSTSSKATRGGGGAKTLIARLTTQRWLDVGAGWTEGEHGAAHSRLHYEYRVTCDAHYYGAGCGSLCRPRDDSFGHYTCSPMGQIVCVPGWQGDYCTKPRCLPGCDDQHGHCNQPNECLCHSGWKGPLCDQCERYPGCLHGSCHKPWDCLCDEGWGGLFCNQDLNYCTNHRPCRHGGTCFNTGQGSYTCSCPPGRVGTDCEKLVDRCAQRPCLNGATCRDNGTTYMCECPKHWYGAQCEISAKTCGDLPCQNGATCTEGAQGYKCQCLGGYSGVDCETQTDDCSPNPCRNGAICTDLVNGYQCNCPDGFVGADCEVNVNDCVGNPCLNGGSCLDLVNQFRCQCVPGYVGQLCQSKVDYCLAKPCANGGLCSDLVNDYRCACRPGFSGKDCSIDINECAKKPCLNGGRCVDRVNGFRCVCMGSWIGQLCGEEEGGSVGNISRHVSEREDSALSSEHIVVIATLSTAVPLLVLVAAVVVVCMKQRRARERRKADDEARMQNEQNAVHSSVTKRGDAHMIKNTWGPCMKDMVVGGSEVCFAAKQVAASPVLAIPPDLTPVYTLHRSRSHKQLNTDASVHRQSNRASCKDLDNLARTDKRISILSVDSSLCNTSDQSLLKRSHDKDGTLPSSSVYVIDDHFTRHNDTLLATEV